MDKENPIKTAIIRIAEKIDYLEDEIDRIKDNENLWGNHLEEELEELLEDIK